MLTLPSYVSSAVEDSIDQLNRRQYDQDRRDIANWLTPIDYATQQSDFIARRQEGTGLWLLDSDEFQKWLNIRKQMLFCPGMPGAGKTMITSIIVEHLQTKFRNEPNIGIAYLYCNFRRKQEQQLVDLLASLLKQLLQRRPSVPENVTNLYKRHNNEGSRPSSEEISKVLHSVITSFSRAFIIVDALDECPISDGGRTRLLSEIFDLRAKTEANLFTTSRFIPEIMKKFEGNVSLEIRAIDEDVRRYLDGHMSLLPSFVLRSLDMQEEIKTAIVKAVDGMYVSSHNIGPSELTFIQVSPRTASPGFINRKEITQSNQDCVGKAFNRI
jgi:Cdc6-like AAA superfamily ATPase